MSLKHRPEREPQVNTARDSRQAVHKYYPIDDSHSFAVPAGRCAACGKITDCYCDRCSSWACENHLKNENGIDLCNDCTHKSADSE